MIIQAGRAAGAGPRPRQYIEMHGATIMGAGPGHYWPLLTSDNTLHGDIHQPQIIITTLQQSNKSGSMTEADKSVSRIISKFKFSA